MTEFGSFDNSMCKRVLDLLKPGDVTLGQVVIKRVAVVELGVNNGSGDGGGCFSIEVQTCIWPSGCHCHSLSLASVKSRLVVPFWYRLTRVVPEKGPLNGCVLFTNGQTEKWQSKQWQR